MAQPLPVYDVMSAKLSENAWHHALADGVAVRNTVAEERQNAAFMVYFWQESINY